MVVDTQYKPVFVVQINRPLVRNAVDGQAARLLHDAFVAFAEDDDVSEWGFRFLVDTVKTLKRSHLTPPPP